MFKLEELMIYDEYKKSNIYQAYINKKATIVIVPSGKGDNWKYANIHVNEYTGYRYVSVCGQTVSLKKLLKSSWGDSYELPQLSSPPYFREKWNEYQKNRRGK